MLELNLDLVSLKLCYSNPSCYQNKNITQWKKICSIVSSSFSQKSYKGQSTFLNLNSILFVHKILFNILYWNSLNLVSNVDLKGSKYIFSQSSWDFFLFLFLFFFCNFIYRTTTYTTYNTNNYTYI